MASSNPVLELTSSLHTAIHAVFAYSEKFEKPDEDDSKLLCYKHFHNLNTPTMIKQLFLIGDRIASFKKLLEAERDLRYGKSCEIYGKERDAYFELEYTKGKKDKAALKIAQEAYEKKKAIYDLFLAPRDEPLKKAFDLKQGKRKTVSKGEKLVDEKTKPVLTTKVVSEEDPSNTLTKSEVESTPKNNSIVDDLLLLFPSEMATPAQKIPEDVFDIKFETASKTVPAPTLLISASEDEVPLSTRKKAIPKHVKTLVWNTHVGVEKLEAKCFSCRVEKIDARYFQCGHVIAEAKGGDLTIKNLRPICGPCNSSMGTKSMNDFTKEYFGWEV
jgi:hypothetical protein